MNFTRIVKAGSEIAFGEGQRAPASGALASLPDGAYIAGFRPDHLHLHPTEGDGIRFRCRLRVTEITGSETFVHLDHGEDRWVGLMHGVHQLELGAPIDVWLGAPHVYVFADSGPLVAPALYAAAA
jgi:glycerol transport system ATP-binding protein